jgi:hypothetical protein
MYDPALAGSVRMGACKARAVVRGENGALDERGSTIPES